jgi:hypothetical protein
MNSLAYATGNGLKQLPKGDSMKQIHFQLFSLVVFSSMMVPSISSADQQVRKISYECKGNTRTFIGPNEVPDMQKGKKFSFQTSGVAGAFDLKLGADANQPDIQITPIGKNLLSIHMTESVPLSVEGQSGAAVSSGDMSTKFKHGFGVETKANGLGLSGDDEGGSEVVSQWRDGFHGNVVIQAGDGSLRFGTADGKSLECKINID